MKNEVQQGNGMHAKRAELKLELEPWHMSQNGYGKVLFLYAPVRWKINLATRFCATAVRTILSVTTNEAA